MTGKTKSKRERKAVIALIRVSTFAQAEEGKYGIPAQREACERIARANNLDVRWTIDIEGVSGAAIRKSPQLEKLLGIVKSGACDGIVMREESRLMRRVDSQILDILEENQVKLYLPDTVLDFSNASERLLGNVKFSIGDYERSVIRERTVSGKLSKRARGEWASGRSTVPYGLELYQDGKRSLLRAERKTVERVKDLFSTFIKGGGFIPFTQLAKQCRIPYHSVDYILRNEIYTGYHVPWKTADPWGNVYREDGSIRYQKRKMIPVEERPRIKMFDDAPISQTTFAQAQSLLALRREMRVKVRNTVTDPFLYRGLLRCAECDRKLITVCYTNKPANFTAEYYVCQGAHGARKANGTWKVEKETGKELKSGSCPTRRMRREVLEPILDEIVATRLASPKFLAQIIEDDAKAKAENSEERVKNLDAEIASIERAIDNNHILFVREKITSEKFDKVDGQLQLELRAARIALEKTRPNLARITPESWVPIAEQFVGWRKLKQVEKRALLAAIAPAFRVGGYPGKKYHETKIKVTGLRISLTGGKGDASREIEAEVGDDPGRCVLVRNPNRSYTALESNQFDISLNL